MIRNRNHRETVAIWTHTQSHTVHLGVFFKSTTAGFNLIEDNCRHTVHVLLGSSWLRGSHEATVYTQLLLSRGHPKLYATQVIHSCKRITACETSYATHSSTSQKKKTASFSRVFLCTESDAPNAEPFDIYIYPTIGWVVLSTTYQKRYF